MKHIAFFAGIGMANLAARWMGWENSLAVEWDEPCQKVLQKNFPEMPILGDIKKITDADYTKLKKEIGGTLVVSGGFPCQPWSVAGEGRGTEDERELSQEMLRAIEILAPEIVVAENVGGIANRKNIHHLEFICKRLESFGYTVVILDSQACAFGLQTVERHIWIIAKANKKRQQGEQQKTVPKLRALSREFQGGNQGELSRRDLSKSRFCRVGERNSRRLDKSGRERLKQVGNAFPPQMIYEIFKAIEAV